MSGLAGVFATGGQQHSPATFRQLMAAIEHRGLDASSTWRGPNLELGVQAWHTTPEDQLQVQPLCDAESGMVIHFDGRLDHRGDLSKRLGLSSMQEREWADVSLVLHAFKTWDCKAFTFLEGEFALAIWDPNRATLFCARDYLGLRPFFYTWSNDLFCWGSELKQLAQITD